ncbi:MAG: GNAT family N-acetyltransferase [Flavobacteriaceae bacterium]|nr:GNAT family N-acetyltransferase [Flavobacteriaceae bacterium]
MREELYEILRFRSEIFVVEQNCVFQDIDEKDFCALHLFLNDSKTQKIIAYARLFQPGDYYFQASIGRVAIKKEFRSEGLGHQLMKKAIEEIDKNFHTKPIKIGAQLYLKDFYETHDFKQIDDEYIEDGIPHIHMLRK